MVQGKENAGPYTKTRKCTESYSHSAPRAGAGAVAVAVAKDNIRRENAGPYTKVQRKSRKVNAFALGGGSLNLVKLGMRGKTRDHTPKLHLTSHTLGEN